MKLTTILLSLLICVTFSLRVEKERIEKKNRRKLATSGTHLVHETTTFEVPDATDDSSEEMVEFCEHHDGTGKCCFLKPGLYEGAVTPGLQTEDEDQNPCPGDDALSYVHILGHCAVTLDVSNTIREADAVVVDLDYHRTPANHHETTIIIGPGTYRGSTHFRDEEISSVQIRCDDDIQSLVGGGGESGRRNLVQECKKWWEWDFFPFTWTTYWIDCPGVCCATGLDPYTTAGWDCCPDNTKCGQSQCSEWCLEPEERCCQDGPETEIYGVPESTGFLDVSANWIAAIDVVIMVQFRTVVAGTSAKMVNKYGATCFDSNCNTGYANTRGGTAVDNAMNLYGFLMMGSQQSQWAAWWTAALNLNGKRNQLETFYSNRSGYDCYNVRAYQRNSIHWSTNGLRDFMIQCTHRPTGNTKTIWNLHIPVCSGDTP